MSVAFLDAKKCLQRARHAINCEDSASAAKALMEHDAIIRGIEIGPHNREVAEQILFEQKQILKEWGVMLEDLKRLLVGQRRNTDAVRAYLAETY